MKRPTPPGPVAVTGLATILVAISTAAWSQTTPQPSAPTGNLASINTIGSTWQNFITTQLQPQLNAILSGAGGGENYVTWASTMVVGGFTVTCLIALYKWVWGAASAVDVVTVFARGVIISGLYAGYSSWTGLLYNASYELSFLIQQQALGDSTVMGPAVFVAKALSAIDFGTSSIFTLTISGVIYATFFLGLEVILIVMSFFVAAWPTLLYAIATIVGPIMFPFLFFEQLSSFFDGWLRLFFSAMFFLIISRIVLVVIALLFGSFFSVSYSTSPQISAMVVDTTSLANVVVLFVLSGTSIFLLFYSGSLVAQIVGGSNLGLSSAVTGLVKFAARFVGKS